MLGSYFGGHSAWPGGCLRQQISEFISLGTFLLLFSGLLHVQIWSYGFSSSSASRCIPNCHSHSHSHSTCILFFFCRISIMAAVSRFGKTKMAVPCTLSSFPASSISFFSRRSPVLQAEGDVALRRVIASESSRHSQAQGGPRSVFAIGVQFKGDA